jgi:hypothetical protein
MAYMDVKPDNPNGHTMVLLHGKLFCAATWEGTIKVLSAAGYRVIAPKSGSANLASPRPISSRFGSSRKTPTSC